MQGDWTWVDPEGSGEFGVAMGARVVSVDHSKVTLITDEKKVNLHVSYMNF